MEFGLPAVNFGSKLKLGNWVIRSLYEYMHPIDQYAFSRTPNLKILIQ